MGPNWEKRGKENENKMENVEENGENEKGKEENEEKWLKMIKERRRKMRSVREKGLTKADDLFFTFSGITETFFVFLGSTKMEISTWKKLK